MAQVEKFEKLPVSLASNQPRAYERRVSQSTGRLIGKIITYGILIAGALVMLFPMFWLFTASFKPPWEIQVQPPIWIPSEWLQVPAGTTPEDFPLYRAQDPAGQQVEVIKIGTRRYTSAVDVSTLSGLNSVPSDQLSSAQPTAMGGVTLNIRQWTTGSGTQAVVALGRDGDNLIVAPADAVAKAAQQMPLDQLNAAPRKNVKVSTFSFQARELSPGGPALLMLGPESELTVVGPKDTAAQSTLVANEALAKAELAPVGQTDVQLYSIAGRPADERYLLLGSEAWQPVIDLDEVTTYGLYVSNDKLTGTPTEQTFNLAAMPVVTVTQDDGKQIQAAVLLKAADKTFVIPVAHTTTLRLTPLGKLGLPFVQNIGGASVPYRDDYEEHGKRSAVAIVGERRDMALVVPKAAVSTAFDVPAQSIQMVLRVRFYIENYIDAFSKDLGGANFLTFFRNSAILVLLNLLGHFLSITVVSYGFARLNAPGKNFLFMVLLATMMLPFPVLVIPTYEIFNGLGMLNTLWPLFIRSFFGNAFLIFLLRQFFMSIPRELEEAARIDGARTTEILWHIMLPLSKPALATIGIFTFWWTWNAFFEPFIYVNNVKNFTVSLGLAFFKGQYVTSYHLLMAASMVSILPIILIFFFAQRYFIEGIQLQGLKG